MQFIVLLLTLCSIATPAFAATTVLRVGHFPNVTHAQGVIGHALTRQGKGWSLDLT